MTLKIRIPRPFFTISKRGSTALAASPAAKGTTFHAMLTDYMDEWVVERLPNGALRQSPRSSKDVAMQAPDVGASLARPASLANASSSRQTRPGSLTRAWSWLHSKYAMSATKRLRVSETVSLGEKRFVALVCVEGREFLIGGGAASISLLSALGAASEERAERSDAEVSA